MEATGSLVASFAKDLRHTFLPNMLVRLDASTGNGTCHQRRRLSRMLPLAVGRCLSSSGTLRSRLLELCSGRRDRLCLAGQLGESPSTMGAGRGPSRWQGSAAAWAVRRQSYSAMRTELPVRCELAVAFETLVEELVPFLMQLQQCRLHPALLGLLMLFLVVHGVPLRGIEH